jgi:hypothetical protein
MGKGTYHIVLRETYILLIYSHRTMKKTTMMLAIISAIVATGLAVSPTLATPVFAQSASSTGAATDDGSAGSSGSFQSGFHSSSSSGAGEDVTCQGFQGGGSRCDAIR